MAREYPCKNDTFRILRNVGGNDLEMVFTPALCKLFLCENIDEEQANITSQCLHYVLHTIYPFNCDRDDESQINGCHQRY